MTSPDALLKAEAAGGLSDAMVSALRVLHDSESGECRRGKRTDDTNKWLPTVHSGTSDRLIDLGLAASRVDSLWRIVHIVSITEAGCIALADGVR